MKNLFYLFALILATTLLSCSDDMEQDNSKTTADIEEQSATNLLTRASIAASDSISPLEMNDSMRYLLNLQKKVKKPRKIMSTPEDYDVNFSDNMFAIRELPVTIEVMEAGKDKSRKYLYCDKAGAEVRSYLVIKTRTTLISSSMSGFFRHLQVSHICYIRKNPRHHLLLVITKRLQTSTS